MVRVAETTGAAEEVEVEATVASRVADTLGVSKLTATSSSFMR